MGWNLWAQNNNVRAGRQSPLNSFSIQTDTLLVVSSVLVNKKNIIGLHYYRKYFK
jgi:hypothetical protein